MQQNKSDGGKECRLLINQLLMGLPGLKEFSEYFINCLIILKVIKSMKNRTNHHRQQISQEQGKI